MAKKILVVEDEAIVARDIEQTLTNLVLTWSEQPSSPRRNLTSS